MADQPRRVALIVEDEADFRRVYGDALEHEGFVVLHANDGQQGLQLIKTERPDVILLDLVLPKLPGLELLERIKSDTVTRDIPVLVCSVLGQDAIIKQAMALGADKYFYKGKTTPGEIAQAFKHALNV